MTGAYKIDYKLVAYYFGKGATYDTIFNRFRNAIKASKGLIEEAEARSRPPTQVKSPSGRAPRKGRTTPNKTSKKRPAGKNDWQTTIAVDETTVLKSTETLDDEEPTPKKLRKSLKEVVDPPTEDTETKDSIVKDEYADDEPLADNDGDEEV